MKKNYESNNEMVKLFSDWAEKNVSKFLVSEGHTFSEEHWLGGIVDCIYEDKEGRMVVMDFKSSKEAYLSQFLQIAGYDLQIQENGIVTKDGEQIMKPRSVGYYAVFPFGMKNPAPQFYYDTEKAREGFLSAVVLHKLINS